MEIYIFKVRNLLTFLFCFWLSEFIAQRSLCGNPAVMENNCLDACVVCNLDGLSSSSGHTIPGSAPPGYCTAVVHSIHYLAFVAGSTNLSFDVFVGPCSLGNAIELGVYETPDCSSFNLVSNCNTFMPTGATYSFTSTRPLKIGCLYFIVIDGNGPAICNYSISVTFGSALAPMPQLNGPIMGKTNVCPGAIETYSILNAVGACDYDWQVIGGDKLSQTDLSVTVQWNNSGNGRVCVSSSNACHQSNQICLDVEIGENSPPIDIGPLLICPNTSTIFNGKFYPVGQHEVMLLNYKGCDSIINLTVEEYPPIIANLDTIMCFPACLKIQNEIFCQSGSYSRNIKSKISPYCDSTIYLDLNILRAEIKINSTGHLSCSDTLVVLHADSSIVSGNGLITKGWYDENGKLLDTTSKLSVKNAGIYIFRLQIQAIDGQICSHEDSIEVKGSRLMPDLFIDQNIKTCRYDPIILANLNIKDKNQTASRLLFSYTGFFDSLNLISTDSIFLFQDTTIYVMAISGNCSDTLRLDLTLKESPKIKIDSIFICNGTQLNLNLIPIININGIDSIEKFYPHNTVKPNERIDSTHLFLLDTTLYLISWKDGCAVLDSLHINVLNNPDIHFELDKNIICLNDTLRLTFHDKLPNEVRYLIFNSDSISIVDSILKIKMDSIGIFGIKAKGIALICQDSFEKIVRVQAPLKMPEIYCLSTDSTVTFSWDSLHQSQDYDVVVLQGINGQRISDYVFKFDQLAPNELVGIRIILKDSICGNQFKELSCQAISCPNILLEIDKIDTICFDRRDTFGIPLSVRIDSTRLGFVGSWKGKGLRDSFSNTWYPSLSGPGDFTVEYFYTNKNCINQVSQNISILRKPVANYISDTIVCLDSTLVVFYAGEFHAEDIEKIDAEPGAMFIADSLRNTFFKWSSEGLKKVTINLSNGPCNSSWQTSVLVKRNPPPPLIYCQSTDSSIRFSWNLSKEILQYKIESDPVASYQMLNDSTIIFDNLPSNTTLKFRLQLQANGPCSEFNSDWVACTTLNCPNVSLFQRKIISGCFKNLPNQIDLNVDLNPNFSISTWSGNDVNQFGIFDISSAGPGIHFVFVESTLNQCIYRDTITIDLTRDPEINTLNIIQPNCRDQINFGQIEFELKPDENLPFIVVHNFQDTLTQTIFNNLPLGAHHFRIINKVGCFIDTSIVFIAPDTPQIDLGPDLIIKRGELIQLHAVVSGTYQQISWNSSIGLSCFDCLNPYCSIDESKIYSATIRNEQYCYDTDSIELIVIDNRVYVPNIFSPNKDNVNDGFTLFGSDDIQEIEFLQIFDRWGNLVFSKAHFEANLPELGWDGKYKGKDLNPAVFAYVAKVNFKIGQPILIKGELQLLR
ncbi:MAG: gliding motility-associated C-terminal domain-containing protein [Bacteroidota bacterium]|nr:gliding motility-associated C-terminal domain-containing protein [Bacteroidota bacterium]